jgi:hypothetical protein
MRGLGKPGNGPLLDAALNAYVLVEIGAAAMQMKLTLPLF